MPRFTIDVGADLDEDLSDLARSQGVTKAEVIRKAVAVYAMIKPEVTKINRKKQVAIIDNDDKVIVKVAIP